MTDSSGSAGTPALATRLVRLGVVLGIVVVLQAGLIAAFVTATRNPVPRQLPVAVVGPPREAALLQSRLPGAGAFTVRQVPSVAAAEEAIRRQQFYGAFVVGSHQQALLVASAASPLVAQVLTKAFTPFAQARGKLTIQDVVPLPAADPRGVAVPYLILGLVIGGYIGAMVIGRMIGMRSLSVRHLGLRLGVLVCYSVVTGAIGLILLDPVIGAMHGHALAIAAAGALVAFAVGCFTSALQTLLGLTGTLLSVVTLVLIGNPAAGGGQIPPALMPTAWGWLARGLPNPAGMTAIRGIEFFSGYGTGQAFLVLGLYAAGGIAVMLALAVVPAARMRRQAPAGAAEFTGDLAAEAGSGAAL